MTRPFRSDCRVVTDLLLDTQRFAELVGEGAHGPVCLDAGRFELLAYLGQLKPEELVARVDLVEALPVRTVAGKVPAWTLEVHDQTIESYFKRCGRPSGQGLPRFYEAVTLDLAERYRIEGDIMNCRRLVALAVETHPGHQGLLGLEASIDPDTPIHGADVLPPRSEPESDV